jgi:transaldolase
MKETYFHRVQKQTPTRFWINNVTREQADLALDAGAVGCTQNPAYTWKMMESEQEKPHVIELICEIIKDEPSNDEALVKLQRTLIADIARYFMPLYEKSGHRQGFVSIQGDPFHEDVETIVRYARYNVSASPNLMAKIPVTEDGLKAIRILLSEGIAINATEVMAVRQAMDVCDIYNEVCSGMENPPVVYFSHITGIYDEYLQNTVREQNIDVSTDALWHAGMAIARKTYTMAKAYCPAVGFIGGGARGLHHFTEMVGADAVITINWNNTADTLIEQDPVVCQRFFMPVPDSVIDELCEKIPDFLKGYFVNNITPEEYEEFGPVVLFRSTFEKAWKNALEFIERQRKENK